MTTKRKARNLAQSWAPLFRVAVLAILYSAGQTHVLNAQQSPNLSQATLEDLLNIEVTSVSKKEQKLAMTPAAVYVLTREEIRHSGATNIPDLLRWVPGVEVARIDAHTWAIGIRGFNDRYQTKVLVLIDGRSVYTSAFSGVYWDGVDVPLEDIDRIEVIRGPGGTVWGANAVNGVINIITLDSRATHGGLVSATAGARGTADGLAQYGAGIGSTASWRAFADYSGLSGESLAGGARAPDGFHAGGGGFRTDWDLSPKDKLTVQGDLHQTDDGQTISAIFPGNVPQQRVFNDPGSITTGDLLGRWTHSPGDGSETSLQIYTSDLNRLDTGLRLKEHVTDFDFQQHRTLESRQDIVWGVDVRVTGLGFTPGYGVSVSPSQRTDSLFSGFFQDEIQIANRVWLTAGTKVEHNAYTGIEVEPSAQLVWTPSDTQTVWFSAARAIRQPSAVDSGVAMDSAIVPVPGGALGLVQILGNPGSLKPERLLDFEGGYRTQVTRRLSLDAALFANSYNNLTTLEPQSPYPAGDPASPYIVLPYTLANLAHAFDYGFEFFATWNVTSKWTLNPGYSGIHMNVAPDASSQDYSVRQTAGSTPAHQFQLRSRLDMKHNLEWDAMVEHIGSLPAENVPAYTRLDTRIGWRWKESMEFSIAGQDLLAPRHAEFGDAYGLLHTMVSRTILAKITWRF